MSYLSRLITILLFFSFVSACADIEKPAFLRSDCIVEIELQWQDSISLLEREKIRRAIGDGISSTIEVGSGLPRPSIAYKGANKEFLYLQYREQCDAKEKITNQLLAFHVGPKVSGFPDYHISNKVVIPNPDTIDIYGPYWADGEIELPQNSSPVKINYPSGKTE